MCIYSNLVEMCGGNQKLFAKSWCRQALYINVFCTFRYRQYYFYAITINRINLKYAQSPYLRPGSPGRPVYY